MNRKLDEAELKALAKVSYEESCNKNKGLEAFDKALDIICCQKHDDNLQTYIDITETELKEKDELEEMFNNDEELIKKLDKKVMYQDEILRIIKDKEVEIGLLKGILHADKSFHTASYYNSHFVATYRHLTQAEFDLLKGWLN